MGYTVSIEAIERVSSLLDILLTSKEPILTLESADPKKLVFLIRSALHSIKEFNYEKYLPLINAYEIKHNTKVVTFIKRVGVEVVITSPHRSFPEFDDLEVIDYLTKTELSTGVEYRFPRYPDLIDWIAGKGLLVNLTDTNLIVTLPPHRE